MKLVDKKKATATLAAYAEQLASGPVVLTERGKPVAALVALENVDLETVSLSTNPRFMEVIERSRRRVRAEGGVSSAKMRRRFDKGKPKGRAAQRGR
jgi:antitoxin (DNA-binding transcriptional repressor) of toxin-antitoxin stability system